MLYGSENWCLGENETAVLRRTEMAVIRGMCGFKLIEKRSNQELINLLGVEQTEWNGMVICFWRVINDMLKALNFEVVRRRGRERTKMAQGWKMIELPGHIGSKKEDAISKAKCRNGVYEVSRNMRRMQSPSLTERKPDLKNWISLFLFTYKKSATAELQ